MSKLTREDIMNGWTEDKLAAYLTERQSQQKSFMEQNKNKNIRIETTAKFNPHDW